ncbi:zinc finger protein 182-like isoform X2 [Topomyia yanbarensis]|uniref:zinc finger protein 182-like isoform X2 n=1 Tax=Topomyia yanbarensis TaxID=2498891 RepID=UPI00273C3655|nr:zinc finger protein 182-like isoform X2 [Topomyia yanbarensis]
MVLNGSQSFVISTNDGLPQKICKHCLATLTKMHETINAFQENDRMLRLQQLSQVDIKEEIFDTEETEQALADAWQFDIIAEEYLNQTIEEIQEVDKLEPDDEKVDEIWLPPEPDNQSDGSLEEKPVLKKRNRKRNRKAGTEMVRKGRPRTRFRDPNGPRMNDFKCYICKSDSLGTPGALLTHLDSHLDKVPYTCTECVVETIVINKVTTLNIHKRMHENPHKCPHCDRRYSDKKAIDTHVQAYHLGENAPCPSTCEQCGKVCTSKSSLKQHMRLHISGSACEFCGKLFVAKQKLLQHIDQKHKKLKKYECHLCQKKLCSLGSVQVHIKTMHSTKEVRCEYCDRSYPSEISLRYHLKKHEQDPNGTFSSDWKNFYTLVEAEDNKSENRLKKCNLCGDIVKYISPHMNTVHFPKEFRCEVCGAVYKKKSMYKIHVLEHEHGKALRCPICGKEFSDRKALISHLRTKKHQDHPLAKSLDWLGVKRVAGTGSQVKKNDTDVKQTD